MTKTSQSQNGNGTACLPAGKDRPPESAYKAGRLTLAGWLMTVESCPKSFENLFADKTRPFRAYGKELLTLWKQRGYPDLGNWPPQDIELALVDYALGAIASKVASVP
jgi:hypothetical protein